MNSFKQFLTELSGSLPYNPFEDDPWYGQKPWFPDRGEHQGIPSHIDRDDFTLDLYGFPVLTNPPKLVPGFWDKPQYDQPHGTMPEFEYEPNPFDRPPPLDWKPDRFEPGFVNPPRPAEPYVPPPPQWWDPYGLGRRPIEPMPFDAGPDPDGPRPYYPRQPEPYDGPYGPDTPPTGPDSLPPYQAPVMKKR